MSDFKRSPSKVWWASESLEWREVSKSPASQDSGFSDTETSPTHQKKSKNNLQEQNNNNQIDNNNHRKSVDIFKQSEEKPQNLSSNFKEKCTPDKNLANELSENNHGQCVTPKRYTKHSPKVSRCLFKGSYSNHHQINQYSKSVAIQQETTTQHSSTSKFLQDNDDDGIVVSASKTLPSNNSKEEYCYFLHHTAPPILQELKDEEDLSFNNSLSSDCESELECLFNGPFDSPQHTSTPKSGARHSMPNRGSNNKLPLNLYVKFQQRQRQQQRYPEIVPEPISNEAVNQWMHETKNHYEQECMTTLQAKSIAAELNEKVTNMAMVTTAPIQGILAQSECIENEYKHLNGERKHVGALAQSLAGNVIRYMESNNLPIDPKIVLLYDNIRKCKTSDCLRFVLDLFDYWQLVHQDIQLTEVKNLILKLEHPCSELDLRATVTGITSTCLRYDCLVDLFTKNDIIPILLTLCEKCEGSSLRCLLLRALTIMCSSAFTVREFEKYSGIQIIADTITDDLGRPEPERAEAVALLAQVTAPWIEDNHSIRGLATYSKSLIKYLTKFVTNTKCCQNLLLCAAALANLSALDAKCIKYMMQFKTSDVLLKTIQKKGPCVSIYLLEQVATLIANISSSEVARKHLSEIEAAKGLLCFLKRSQFGGDVEKRLQQKAIIALSRLCSDRDAASQVVQCGGVDILVRMCKKKEERFDNDAVLVATLATLRKIADACGSDVISEEDAQELVEPKLLDSFLAYSAQSESYV